MKIFKTYFVVCLGTNRRDGPSELQTSKIVQYLRERGEGIKEGSRGIKIRKFAGVWEACLSRPLFSLGAFFFSPDLSLCCHTSSSQNLTRITRYGGGM